MKTSPKKSKRFIAGAVCPQCHKIDVIALLNDEKTGKEAIECVACGYFYDQESAQFEKQATTTKATTSKITWHHKDR